jgi:hypothetical protein
MRIIKIIIDEMKKNGKGIPRTMSWCKASLTLMDLMESTVSETQPMEDSCGIEKSGKRNFTNVDNF